MAEVKLGRWQLLMFALPGLPIAWLIPPMYAILGDFYLRYSAATAAGIGSAMLFSKVVDAITDPPVGYLSDRTRSRWGARKPWILAGALLTVPTFLFFFNPPESAGNLYFAVGITAYYLCHTLIKIPLRAWLGELTPDYTERSHIWSWFVIALLLGGLLIMGLPLLMSSPLLPLFDSAEFDRDMMSMIGLIGLCGMPVLVLGALWVVPQGHRNEGDGAPLLAFFEILWVSRPFQNFLVGYGLSALGFGIFYSVIIVAITSYYGFAEKLPLFMLIMILVQVASIPVWEKLAHRVPKHQVWAYAWLAHAALGLLMFVFGANSTQFWLIVSLGGVLSALQGPHMLFPVSIMNDIVDYDTWKTGISRAGNFFSVFTFVDKVLHAIGFGVGYYCMALFGYDAKLDENTDLAVFGLKLAFILLPALLFFLSSRMLLTFPIDAHRHAIIRKRLAAREARERRVAAIEGAA